jgi:hypothetical protein
MVEKFKKNPLEKWKGRRYREDGTLSAIQHCEECGRRLVPLHRSHKTKPDEWAWMECDVCGGYVCSDPDCCSNGLGPEKTELICTTCKRKPWVRNFYGLTKEAHNG